MGAYHPAILHYTLCKEFGWTPDQVDSMDAKTVEEFLVIMQELNRMREMELRRIKRIRRV